MAHITIVTGGSRGIGAATARLCAAAGHAVCIAFRSQSDAADGIVQEIRNSGGTAMAVRADTAREDDVHALFEAVDRAWGRLTGLVNNAGIHGPRGRVDSLSAADIDDVLAVNVRGYFLCAREAIARMSTKHGGSGGAIVNVSSGSARLGSPGEGVLYAASKGAVNSLTIGLSQEVAAEGIRVNTVAPGLTLTDMPPQDKLSTLGPTVPIGRAADPREIGEAILWLLSDRASYVAGANLRVGGGRI